MKENSLMLAGLTEAEAKVYSMLVNAGSSLASDVTKQARLHRRTVYDALERLVEKGLISYIKRNNRKYFEAQDPKRLLAIMDEKESGVRAAVEVLSKNFSVPKSKEETLFFRGKAALKTIFDEQIEQTGEILVLGASTDAEQIVKFYFPKYNAARVKKKIKMRAVFADDKKQKIPLCDIRYLPKDFQSHMAVNIYGQNVAMILWLPEPYAILIRNKEVADSYRKYFEVMWKVARK